MTSDPAPSDAGVSYFYYRSVATGSDAAVDRILEEARKRNISNGLTGFLHVEDGLFFQWIEGDPDRLSRIVALIMGDPRHSRIEVLGQGRAARREFPDFSMGLSRRDSNGSLTDYLAASGVSTRDPRAYRKAVLDFMHAARRVD